MAQDARESGSQPIDPSDSWDEKGVYSPGLAPTHLGVPNGDARSVNRSRNHTPDPRGKAPRSQEESTIGESYQNLKPKLRTLPGMLGNYKLYQF